MKSRYSSLYALLMTNPYKSLCYAHVTCKSWNECITKPTFSMSWLEAEFVSDGDDFFCCRMILSECMPDMMAMGISDWEEDDELIVLFLISRPLGLEELFALRREFNSGSVDNLWPSSSLDDWSSHIEWWKRDVDHPSDVLIGVLYCRCHIIYFPATFTVRSDQRSIRRKTWSKPSFRVS